MTNSMIALSQLKAASNNVRVVNPDNAAHKALMASIASQGVLQNLVVMPSGKDRYEVIAGGRRLRALQTLAKDKVIGTDYPVPCLVKEGRKDLTEISLAENVQREAMHPADEFEAFARMVEEGISVEDVATKFGVARTVVTKRLKLGRVAPRLLDVYRKGDLTLEAIMAFTVTDDYTRQLACYTELAAGHVSPRAIRQWLLGEAVDASVGIGAFVGKAAYVKAGGAVAGDLFEATNYLCDTELVSRMAQEKLDRAAKKIEQEGAWAWVHTSLERYAATEGLVQLYPTLTEVPEAVAQPIETLGKQIMAWEDVYYGGDLPEGFTDEASFEQAWEAAQEQLETLEAQRDAQYLQFSEAQQSYSGCIVTFNREGKLEVIEGLARRADIPNENQTPDAAQGDASPTEKGLSQSLQDDIGQYRQQIVQAALLKQSALALDVLHYTLSTQLLADQHWRAEALQNAHFQRVESRTSREDTQQGRAFSELEAAREKLPLEWLAIDSSVERFNAFRALSKRAKEALVTYCTAVSLNIGQRDSAAEQEYLIEQLSVEFASYWRPTKENYFERLTIDQLKSQFGPVLGESWLDGVEGAKKGAIVESLAAQFGDTDIPTDDVRLRWLPEGF